MAKAHENKFDVIIVGAGVSGLAAAGELTDAGLTIAVLEARNRIGGRILTHADALSGMPVELGAEFLHGSSPDLQQVMQENSLLSYEVSQDHLFAANGAIEHRPEYFAKLEKLLGEAKSSSRDDLSFAEWLRQRDCEPELKFRATSYVEGFNAADSERISVYALRRQERAEEEIAGDHSFRLFEGYQQLPEALYRRAAFKARLYRNTEAKEVRWRRRQVSISSRFVQNDIIRSFECRKCLITVPLGVLQCSASSKSGIQFSPAVPKIRDAASNLTVGHVVKPVLHFRQPFWENMEHLKEMGFLHTKDSSFPTWWSTLPVKSSLLTAWVGGPKAEKLLHLSCEEVIRQAVRSLGGILQMKESKLFDLLDNWYLHNWQTDIYSCGAYAYVPAGRWWAAEAIAKPVDGTLYFAGEATDYEGHWGTVHGAMASGRRAAEQILRDW